MLYIRAHIIMYVRAQLTRLRDWTFSQPFEITVWCPWFTSKKPYLLHCKKVVVDERIYLTKIKVEREIKRKSEMHFIVHFLMRCSVKNKKCHSVYIYISERLRQSEREIYTTMKCSLHISNKNCYFTFVYLSHIHTVLSAKLLRSSDVDFRLGWQVNHLVNVIISNI